jgi:hypothetical protein
VKDAIRHTLHVCQLVNTQQKGGALRQCNSSRHHPIWHRAVAVCERKTSRTSSEGWTCTVPGGCGWLDISLIGVSLRLMLLL